jgi:ABC-type branched-subunit amino acid transport system substrate-binding protein
MDQMQVKSPVFPLSLLLPGLTRRAGLAAVLAGFAALGAACGGMNMGDFGATVQPSGGPPQQPAVVGTGQIKVGLILPLSAGGNAGVAAQSMKNAAEMALAEFNNPDIQLLAKDDGGTTFGAQAATQQAMNEGAEITLGPLFAQSVSAAAQVARPSGKPVIAFSTDTSVAARGVYLLSFLPQSDVDRIVAYAASAGRRSFIGMVPDNAYGQVVEAAFTQAVARRGGRIVAMQRYPLDKTKRQDAVNAVVQSAAGADALFIPDGSDAADIVQSLADARVNVKRLQLLGSGLWDDPSVAAAQSLQGGAYPAPEPAGYRSFAQRYRKRFNQDPVRTATLSYDAVALVAALVKTHGAQRFSEETLTASSGFAGIDGIFRFRQDGTNERGLAVMRVTPSGGQPIAGSPKSFGGGA